MRSTLVFFGVLGAIVLVEFGALVVSRVMMTGPGAWSLGHFTSYLAAAIRRNLPLGTALEAYAEDLPGRAFLKRGMLRTMGGLLDNGRPLADVMDAYPSVFPAGYRSLVRAGERGGSLEPVLGHLRAAVELDNRTSRLAAAHVLYPATLLMLLSGILAFHMLFVLPRFRMVWGEMGILDERTMETMQFSVRAAPLAMVALLVVTLVFGAPQVVGGLARKFAPGLAAYFSWLHWHLPFLSRFERRRAAAGYSLAASRLLAGGVPVEEALSIAARAAASPHFERIALAAAGRVAEGQKLSAALAAESRPGELPPDLLWYVELGESSGRLPEALSGAADASFSRARGIVRSMVGLIFPIGVILAGLMVGAVCYSVFHVLAAMLEGVMV
ncbi:MAG: type II secretion system F family protein [Planctomycetota bacterium]